MMELDERLHQLLGSENIAARVELDKDEDTQQPVGVYVEMQDRDEHFAVSPDNRHGKDGYRVLRFLPSGTPGDRNHWNWDQWYQFYTTIEAFVVAVSTGDYAQGVENF